MKINRNILWSENFFDRLSALGIKYACISPGSRSTALTFAAASNKKIKCFVHIDERSSAFFALGLARTSGTPVIIITTSGTAVAEIYPAVIEAFMQRIPLIVCTADRPPEMVGRGANQTINQNNIYANNIRYFEDAGMPSASISGIKKIRKMAERAFVSVNEGPVHINFPFRKPFEPDSFTDEFSSNDIKSLESYKSDETYPVVNEKKFDSDLLEEILCSIEKSKSGLIISGPMQYNAEERAGILKLSEKLDFPVLADGSSQLRFGNKLAGRLLINYEGFLRNQLFSVKNIPDLILQFGSTPSSKAIELYLSGISPKRYIINKFGDVYDPWNNASGILNCSPVVFTDIVCKKISLKNKNIKNDVFFKAESIARDVKNKILRNSLFPNECRIFPEIINSLPEDTQLIVSNSMPVRDFDYFAPVTGKNIRVFTNRGASGIDGIISTSLGIRTASQKPALLIIGDSAFLYDLNSLAAADKYKIPLVILLINNNGGGIFSMLPISGYKKIFRDYFTSPHNLDFEPLVKGFNGNYKSITGWEDLRNSIQTAFNKDTFSVLEIKTDINYSVKIRQKYFTSTNKIISKNIL